MSSLHQRIRRGEPSAFVELYDGLGDRLYRYAFARLRSSNDASDVVQEIFVRLVKSHRALSRADDLTSYIFAVARTEIIRWRQKNSPSRNAERASGEPPYRPQDAADIADGSHSGEQTVEGREWVQRTLDHLNPVDQEIIQLKVFSQLTFKEIGVVLGMDPNTVATRHRRAIQRLQRHLKPKHADDRPMT